jgi:ABC-type Zn uptake system ZnuABC Zn-binding protein ZnuA
MAKEMVEKIDIGNDAMKYFRIFQVSRYPQAPIMFTKYVARRNELFKLPGGRELMEARLKAYLAEVEKALDNLASIVEKVEKGKGDKQIVLAEKYNVALSDFTENYGRPEGWLRGVCRKSGADTLRKCRIKLLTQKKIDIYMEPNSTSEYADRLSRKMNDYN